jgi:hypothetical protein
MKPGHCSKPYQDDSAVANMIEYLMISAVIMGLLILMILLVNTNIMENPANRLVYVAFTDIGNGVSTRMVDVYSIAPQTGNITTKFDIPDEIVGKSYFVEVGGNENPNNPSVYEQYIRVYRNDITTDIALSGIAATGSKGTAGGNTTGAGINVINYCSEGCT